MKTSITLSLPVELLAEARGSGMDGTFSKLLEEKIREVLHKDFSPEEKEEFKLEQLTELKQLVHIKANLYPLKFKAIIRALKWRGEKSDTLDEKISFWGMVLQEFKKNEIGEDWRPKKEVPPLETPEESGSNE